MVGGPLCEAALRGASFDRGVADRLEETVRADPEAGA